MAQHSTRRSGRAVGLTASTALVLGVGVTAVAGPAAAAEPGVDISPPVPSTHHVYDLEITDRSVYVATAPTARGEGPGPDAAVWRRTLNPSPNGWTLSDAGRVGTAATDTTAALAAWQDAVLWSDAATGALHRLSDDGTTAAPAGPAGVPPQGWSDPWWTSLDELHGPGGHRTDLRAWPDDAGEDFWDGGGPVFVEGARVSATTVSWYAEYVRGTGSAEQRGGGVLAAPLGPDGLTGPAVLVDHGDLTGTGTTPTRQTDLSDDTLVWVATTPAGTSVVRWLPTADLAGEPSELAVPGPVRGVATDGDLLAFTYQAGDDGVLRVVRLADPSDVVLEVATFAQDVELRGDVVAWAAWVPDGSGGARHAVRAAGVGGPTVGTLDFPDVPDGHPFGEEIDWLVLRGIATGYDDGTFRPTAAVSRQAMAAFLYRSAGSPVFVPPTVSPFDDVGTAHPFYAEIAWLADRGISTGTTTDDGRVLFKPTDPVSRQAMAAFLHRSVGSPPTPTTPSGFADVAPGQVFAGQIAWLAEAGISTGTVLADGRVVFRPAEPVSRQAMAAFLQRMAALT